MKTILVPVDFSKVSRYVLAEAARLARLTKARLVLLNIVQPPAVVTDLAPLVGEALQLTAELEVIGRRHLHRLQKSPTLRGLKVEAICEQGFPVAQILAQAKRLRADVIVLGSHGHGAVYHLVVGSTANGILKHASCPVLIVPAPEKRRKAGK
jgi:nucleotide-binding universal stress UspA family protein